MDDGSVAGHAVRSYPFSVPDRLELDPMYAYLREHEPLPRVRLPYGEDAWLVVGYDDVRTVLGDPRFSRAATVDRDVPRLHPEKVSGGLIDLDPPEHTRLRRLIAKAFTVRRVEQLRSRAGQVAADLLDGMLAAGQPADLVDGLALPLPGVMICELLGVPYADRGEFAAWAEAFVSTTALTGEQRRTYLGHLGAYLATLVAQRRQAPTDDLLGALVTAYDEHDRLTEDEVINLALLLLGAGYESTATQLANFVYALLTHPDQLQLLRERPDLIPNAVEELLRWVPLTPTAAALPRYATEDVQLSGGTVCAGEAVLAAKHAANRDPRVFDDPDRLDITREPKAHLASGHGAHHCVGAQLARMDLQVALALLLQRCPGLRLAVAEDQLRWKGGMAVRGLVELPVSW
jgi:cytochrome P450